MPGYPSPSRSCVSPVPAPRVVCLPCHSTSLLPNYRWTTDLVCFFPDLLCLSQGTRPAKPGQGFPPPSLPSVGQPVLALLNKLPVEPGRRQSHSVPAPAAAGLSVGKRNLLLR